MHAKVVVTDDTAFVGSFNLSRSGERNAENVLEIHDATVADTLASYVDEIRGSDTRPRRHPGDLVARLDDDGRSRAPGGAVIDGVDVVPVCLG